MEKLHKQNRFGMIAFWCLVGGIAALNFLPDSVLALIATRWPDPAHKAIAVFEMVLILITAAMLIGGLRQRGERISLILGHVLFIWYLLFN